MHNLINTEEPSARNISQCPNNALYSSTGNVTLTLSCDIQPNELCTFNISASNEAGDSLNGKLSEFHQVPQLISLSHARLIKLLLIVYSQCLFIAYYTIKYIYRESFGLYSFTWDDNLIDWKLTLPSCLLCLDSI